jgi:hypothetical protein
MNSQEKTTGPLNLEQDLPVTLKDLAAMRSLPREAVQDLSGYLEFLEEIGAFETKRSERKYYATEFRL